MEFSSIPEKIICSALHLRTPPVIAITIYIYMCVCTYIYVYGDNNN